MLTIKTWYNNFSADIDRHMNASDNTGVGTARAGDARLSISGGDVN